MFEIFHAVGNETQDDGTLFSLSLEFLEASKVLQKTSPIKIGFTLPTYYLLAHSTELMLKAFLHTHGYSISELRNVRHDLKLLATLALENGLSEKVCFQQILELANIYKSKGLEYRKHKKETFPCLRLLTEEIDALKSVIFDSISRW